MIKIRKVGTSDDEVVEELVELDQACFGGIAELIRDQDCYGHWWIAYDAAEPVAYAAVVSATDAPGSGYLKRCGVLPSYRGQGLQCRLIRVRERCARKLGWSRLITDTTDNPASGNSLIKCGYRLFTPERRWAFDHSCYWEKLL